MEKVTRVQQHVWVGNRKKSMNFETGQLTLSSLREKKKTNEEKWTEYQRAEGQYKNSKICIMRVPEEEERKD